MNATSSSALPEDYKPVVFCYIEQIVAGRSPDFQRINISSEPSRAFPGGNRSAVTLENLRSGVVWPRRTERKQTVVTVAGTVYEFHVLPYSPAFKPAPVTKTKNNGAIYKKKCFRQTPILEVEKENRTACPPHAPGSAAMKFRAHFPKISSILSRRYANTSSSRRLTISVLTRSPNAPNGMT